MKMRLVRYSLPALISILVCGCAGQVQMEQTAYGPVPIIPPICSGNNTAAGAVGGAALGALIGGLAGGRGGAALGAAIGGAGGLAAGAQTDAQCREIASQRAVALAMVQQQAFLAQQVAANQYGPVPVSGPPQEYVSSDTHRHRVRVTQLRSYADPASKAVCTDGAAADDDIDGKTSIAIATARMCRTPDGKFVPA